MLASEAFDGNVFYSIPIVNAPKKNGDMRKQINQKPTTVTTARNTFYALHGCALFSVPCLIFFPAPH